MYMVKYKDKSKTMKKIITTIILLCLVTGGIVFFLMARVSKNIKNTELIPCASSQYCTHLLGKELRLTKTDTGVLEKLELRKDDKITESFLFYPNQTIKQHTLFLPFPNIRNYNEQGQIENEQFYNEKKQLEEERFYDKNAHIRFMVLNGEKWIPEVLPQSKVVTWVRWKNEDGKELALEATDKMYKSASLYPDPNKDFFVTNAFYLLNKKN